MALSPLRTRVGRSAPTKSKLRCGVSRVVQKGAPSRFLLEAEPLDELPSHGFDPLNWARPTTRADPGDE